MAWVIDWKICELMMEIEYVVNILVLFWGVSHGKMWFEYILNYIHGESSGSVAHDILK
jgi:hypothetical protein